MAGMVQISRIGWTQPADGALSGIDSAKHLLTPEITKESLMDKEIQSCPFIFRIAAPPRSASYRASQR
jgi:hypothetical protein